MEMEVDTFLVAVYVIVDDLYQGHYASEKPARPGPQPELSDSEVLTLAILEQWRADGSERSFVAWVQTHWQAYFPRMLSQSAFNRRVRDLAGVLCRVGPEVAEQLAVLLGEDGYEVIDAVPVPVMRRARGARHRLFAAEAAVGRGGTDRDWYYGCSLLNAVAPSGAITGFVVGPANTEGRWLAETLLRWREDPTVSPPVAADFDPILAKRHRGKRRGPSGPIRGGPGRRQSPYYLGDAGFVGRDWQHYWHHAYGAHVVSHADDGIHPTPEQAVGVRRFYASFRQIVETTHSLLTSTFRLAFPRARSAWGLLARVAAKIAALDLALYINALFDRPPLSLFNPLD